MIDRVTFSSPVVPEYAGQPHALNVLISEYDWQRLKEVARIDGLGSVSEVARCALSAYLDALPHSEHITNIAQAAIELGCKAAEMRANVRATIEQA